MFGFANLQGLHHDAQISIRISFPLSSLNVNNSPFLRAACFDATQAILGTAKCLSEMLMICSTNFQNASIFTHQMMCFSSSLDTQNKTYDASTWRLCLTEITEFGIL